MANFISNIGRRGFLAGSAAAFTLLLSTETGALEAQANVIQGSTNMEKVTFHVEDTPLVGDVYTPQESGKRPAVVIIGPMTFQKEQAPTEYAQRLADQGFVTLAYDSRYRGESGGEPRAWENPFHKVEDLKAAVEYIRSRQDVDVSQVSILAICQGSSIAFRAAAEIEGLNALATIAGHYRDAEGDVEWLTEEGLAARKAQGETAKAKFEATGEIDYVKAADPVDMNVGMPGAFVYDWYGPWAERGLWENRYAVMSDADLLAYESISAAETLTTPWLMIHGDYNFLPSAAQRHMEAVPATTQTKTIWDETPHLAYYDQPEAIDRAVSEIVTWFTDKK